MKKHPFFVLMCFVFLLSCEDNKPNNAAQIPNSEGSDTTDRKDRTYIYRLDLNQEAEKILPAQLLMPKEFQDKLLKKVEADWQLLKK